MKRYIVNTPVTLTAQKGSEVILTDQQAQAVKDFVTEAKTKKPPASGDDDD